MNYKKIAKEINNIAPLKLQEEWDNAGWQINLNCPDIERVLVAMDITDEVIDEAIDNDCQLIVTHHPMFFNPLKSVDGKTITGNYMIRLIGAGISVYASHTPFDIVKGGNNDYLGKIMGFEKVSYLEGDDSRICRSGEFKTPKTVRDVVDIAEKALGVDKEFFNYVGDPNAIVIKAGWCTGSGADFIKLAKKAGCDLYMTGDFKYHAALDAKAIGMNVLDLGHFASEHTFVDNMAAKLESLSSLTVIKSQFDNNPFSLI